MSEASKLHLSEADKADIYNRVQKSEAGDVRRQVSGMTALKMAGGALALAFFAVNAYQGVWALQRLTGIGGGSLVDRIMIALVAGGLILGASVVLIRAAMTRGGALASDISSSPG